MYVFFFIKSSQTVRTDGNTITGSSASILFRLSKLKRIERKLREAFEYIIMGNLKLHE